MKFVPTPLAGAFVIEQTPLADDRGRFARVFCARTFRERGLRDVFVQANHSLSLKAGTVRGLHYQRPPFAEAKLVRCVRGAVQDVMIDVRAGSPTFLRWHSEVLSADNLKLVYVPEGFAHGFQALEDGAEVTYQASAEYSAAHEGGVRYNDPRVGIRWLIQDVTVSAKDAGAGLLDGGFTGVVL